MDLASLVLVFQPILDQSVINSDKKELGTSTRACCPVKIRNSNSVFVHNRQCHKFLSTSRKFTLQNYDFVIEHFYFLINPFHGWFFCRTFCCFNSSVVAFEAFFVPFALSAGETFEWGWVPGGWGWGWSRILIVIINPGIECCCRGGLPVESLIVFLLETSVNLGISFLELLCITRFFVRQNREDGVIFNSLTSKISHEPQGVYILTYVSQSLMWGEQILQSPQLSAYLWWRWVLILRIPIFNFLHHYCCPIQIVNHISYQDLLNRMRRYIPVARCKNHAAVLTDPIICHESQVAESFFAILNTFHSRRDVNNSKIEVNLKNCQNTHIFCKVLYNILGICNHVQPSPCIELELNVWTTTYKLVVITR